MIKVILDTNVLISNLFNYCLRGKRKGRLYCNGRQRPACVKEVQRDTNSGSQGLHRLIQIIPLTYRYFFGCK